MFFSKKLLEKSYFKQLEKELYKVCVQIIEQISTSEFNHNIYMFALDVDETNGYILVTANSEELISKTISEIYSDSHNRDILGVRGIKYNTGECEQFNFYTGEISPILTKLAEQYADTLYSVDYEENEKAISETKLEFIETNVNVLNKLRSHFDVLNTTTDFISYVMTHEGEEADIIEIMQKTITPYQMDKVFPEISKFIDYKADIQQLTPEEQAKHWIACYESYFMNPETEVVQLLRDKMYRWRFDILDEIKALGINATTELTNAIVKNIKSCESKQPNKLNNKIASNFLMLMSDIKIADDDCVARLHELLKEVFNEHKNNDIETMIVPLLARTLNALKPEEFPVPIIGDSDNKLKNYTEFGL